MMLMAEQVHGYVLAGMSKAVLVCNLPCLFGLITRGACGIKLVLGIFIHAICICVHAQMGTLGIGPDDIGEHSDAIRQVEFFQVLRISAQHLAYVPFAEQVVFIQAPSVNSLVLGPGVGQLIRELHVVECNITSLQGLGNLPMLETVNLDSNRVSSGLECLAACSKLRSVSLNDNRLRTLAGVDSLPALTELSVARNVLSVVHPCVAECPLLQKLNLADNRLAHFEDVICLSELRSLSELTLVDPHWGPNPVCALSNYTTYLLQSLPRIAVLDGMVIASSDRDAALATFSKKRMYYSMRTRTVQRYAAVAIAQAHALHAQVQTTLQQLQGRVRAEYGAALAWLAQALAQAEESVPDLAAAVQDALPAGMSAPSCEVAATAAGTAGAAAGITAEGSPGHWLSQLLTADDAGPWQDKLAALVHALQACETLVHAGQRALHGCIMRVHAMASLMCGRLMTELNTGGNVRFEEGGPGDAWAMSCVDLLRSRFHRRQWAGLRIGGCQVVRVLRVHNRTLRNIFDTRLAAVVRDSPTLAASLIAQQQQQQRHADASADAASGKSRVLEYVFYTPSWDSHTLDQDPEQAMQACHSVGVRGFEPQHATVHIPCVPLVPGVNHALRRDPSYAPPGRKFYRQTAAQEDVAALDVATRSAQVTAAAARAVDNGHLCIAATAVPVTNSLPLFEAPRVQASALHEPGSLGRVAQVAPAVAMSSGASAPGGEDAQYPHYVPVALPNANIASLYSPHVARRSLVIAKAFVGHAQLPAQAAATTAQYLRGLQGEHVLEHVGALDQRLPAHAWAHADELYDTVMARMAAQTQQAAQAAAGPPSGAGASCVAGPAGGEASFVEDVQGSEHRVPCPPPIHAVCAPASADPRQRVWCIQDGKLILPEYIVEYELQPAPALDAPQHPCRSPEVRGVALAAADAMGSAQQLSEELLKSGPSDGSVDARGAESTSGELASDAEGKTDAEPSTPDAEQSSRSQSYAQAMEQRAVCQPLADATRVLACTAAHAGSRGAQALIPPGLSCAAYRAMDDAIECAPRAHSQDELPASQHAESMTVLAAAAEALAVARAGPAGLQISALGLLDLSGVEFSDLAGRNMPPQLPPGARVLQLTGLPKLQTLLMRGCALQRVWDSLLQDTPQLCCLDLSGNAVQTLPSQWAPERHAALQMLYLAYNCLQSWLPVANAARSFPQLKELDVRGNPITREHACSPYTRHSRGTGMHKVLMRAIPSAGAAAADESATPRAAHRGPLIRAMPSLTRLDGEPVDDEDRVAASAAVRCVTKQVVRRALDAAGLDGMGMAHVHALSLQASGLALLQPSTESAPVSPALAVALVTHHAHDLQRELSMQVNPAELPGLPQSALALWGSLSGLRHLDLSHNHLFDLRPLAAVPTLESLVVHHNCVASLEGLQACTKLAALDVAYNAWTDETARSTQAVLASLPALKQLCVEGNELTHVAWAADCPRLTELYAANNQLAPLRVLRELRVLPKLVIADFAGNPLAQEEDYSLYAVWHMSKLKVHDGVTVSSHTRAAAKRRFAARLSLEFLGDHLGTHDFTQLSSLDVSGNDLRVVDALDPDMFRCLVTVQAQNNEFTGAGVRGFAGLPHLAELDLSANAVQTLAPVFAATSAPGPAPTLDSAAAFRMLEVLRVPANGVKDLSALCLSRIPMLKVLDVSDNNIARLAGLSRCEHLRVLVLSRNKLRSVEGSVFAGAPSLVELYLDGNSIRTASGLTSASRVEVLDLRSNRIGDFVEVDRFAKLAALQHLVLDGNPVCRKPRYRSSVISTLDLLVSLDELLIHDDERAAAIAELVPPSPMGDGSAALLLPQTPSPDAGAAPVASARTAGLASGIPAIVPSATLPSNLTAAEASRFPPAAPRGRGTATAARALGTAIPSAVPGAPAMSSGLGVMGLSVQGVRNHGGRSHRSTRAHPPRRVS